MEVQNLYYDAERTLLLQKIFDLKDLKIRVQKEMEWLKKLTKEKNILTQDFISEDVQKFHFQFLYNFHIIFISNGFI